MPRLTPLPWQKIVKGFEKCGFRVERTSGDHIVMVKDGVDRPLVIVKEKDVRVFETRNNIRTAGLTQEKFLKILNKI